MRTTLHALVSAVLLVGLYVLGAGVVLGLATLSYYAFRYGHAGGAKVGVLALVSAVAVLRGLVSVVRRKDVELGGIPVSRTEEPELWRTVDELAAAVQTRAPDEIRLVPEVNAAVVENTRAMGLLGGSRTMLVGVPLLVGLTRSQLQAVLCHELGHYSGAHTRLAPLAYRGHVALRRLVQHLEDRPVLRGIFTGYAVVYFRVSAAVSRRQELEADEAAVRIAGKTAMASALRDVEVHAGAWEYFLDQYVSGALRAGRRPTDLFGGYYSLLADPERQAHFALVRAEEPVGKASPYDTHPSLAQRLAAVERMPETSVASDDRPAYSLLQNAEAAFGTVAQLLLPDEGQGASWQEAVAAAAEATQRRVGAHLLRAAAHVRGAPTASVGDVLDLLEAGRAAELAAQFAQPDDAEGALEATLAAVVRTALVDAGVAGWALSWSTPYRLVDSAGTVLDVGPAVAAAVAGPGGVAALRATLTAAGVDLAAHVAVPQRPQRDGTQLLGVLPDVHLGSSPVDVLVTDSGLLALPIKHFRLAVFSAQLGGNPRRHRISALLGKGWDELLQTPGAVFLPGEAVGQAAVRKRFGSWSATLKHTDGTAHVLKGGSSGLSKDDVLAVLRECLGDRVSDER